jgi:hypothetical protein
MKKKFTHFLILFILTVLNHTRYAQSGVYASAPIYKDRSYSINELRNSGFTYVVAYPRYLHVGVYEK